MGPLWGYPIPYMQMFVLPNESTGAGPHPFFAPAVASVEPTTDQAGPVHLDSEGRMTSHGALP